MIKGLLRKIMGRKAAAIADTVVTGALDVATGGAASRIEDAVKQGDVVGAVGAGKDAARTFKRKRK